MAIGRRIKEARLNKSITQEELAKMVGVTKGAIANYENNVSHPKESVMYALISALDIDANFLFQDFVKTKEAPSCSDEAMRLAQDYDDKMDDWGRKQVRDVADNEIARCSADRQAKAAAVREERERASQEVSEEIFPAERKVIRLLFDEEKTAAGSGYQLLEDRMSVWKVLYNDLTRKADFCIEVDGRSMEPMIEDGDIILVRQQPAVDIGEIGLFTVNDKGYVKKQGSDRLISVNGKFEDIKPTEFDTVICRGKVIGVLDPEWIVER